MGFPIKHTVKLQIFVRYLFSYFRLETGPYVLIFVLSRVCEKMTLKLNGFKAKRDFHTILNFVLFQKYEMYENKTVRKFVTLQYTKYSIPLGLECFSSIFSLQFTDISSFFGQPTKKKCLRRKTQKCRALACLAIIISDIFCAEFDGLIFQFPLLYPIYHYSRYALDIQPGAVKLVLCGLWMHQSYMHQ